MKEKSNQSQVISADAILLNIVSGWPSTEAVFKKYDGKAGLCLCCTCLFDTMAAVASRFSIDLDTFLADIQKAADEKPERNG